LTSSLRESARFGALGDLLFLRKGEAEVEEQDPGGHEIYHNVLEDEVERDVEAVLLTAVFDDNFELATAVGEPHVEYDSEESGDTQGNNHADYEVLLLSIEVKVMHL